MENLDFLDRWWVVGSGVGFWVVGFVVVGLMVHVSLSFLFFFPLISPNFLFLYSFSFACSMFIFCLAELTLDGLVVWVGCLFSLIPLFLSQVKEVVHGLVFWLGYGWWLWVANDGFQFVVGFLDLGF